MPQTILQVSPEIANEMLLKEYLGKLLKIAQRNSTCCYFKTLY
jgi:hypothetical protein